MRFDPSEMYERLTALGVNVDTDSLRQKCVSVRDQRKTGHRKVLNNDSGVDYLPPIDYMNKGRALHQIPAAYVKDVLNFIGYLSDTSRRTFHIKMLNKKTGECKTLIKPYIHRWTDIYKRGILAKMYQLENYYGTELTDVEFITLTTYQKNLSLEAVMDNLASGREKLLSLLRWRYGTHDYVWVFEPHESGFCHLHMVYFHALTPSDRDNLTRVWSEKYELGDRQHGLYFSEPRASENGELKAGSISRIKGYLMKYISKGLHGDKEYSYNIGGRDVTFSMSLKELFFNSILKKTKHRLWSCSRHIGQIMKAPERVDSEDWDCLEVDQHFGATEEDGVVVLWNKESGLRPSFSWDWKQFSSWTTEPLKELYEKHGYKIEYDKNQHLWVGYERVCVPV